MFDARGPLQRRNARSGPLQRTTLRPIWVDLARAYPMLGAGGARARRDGVDLSSRVPAELIAWRRTSTGEWVGWVCLPIAAGGEVTYVYQYVLADALTPREDVDEGGPGPAGAPRDHER